MGLCGSKAGPQTEEEKKAAIISKELEERNREEFAEEQKKIKLLLLGAGESGKSTLFKQMKILYGTVTDEEQKMFTPLVHNNILSAAKILCQQVEKLGLLDMLQAKEERAKVMETSVAATIDMELGASLIALWADSAIKEAWSRKSEFQIVDSVSKYFDDLDRIRQDNYQATQMDVIYARVRTSGIVTERYEINGMEFEMYDVGGQRNERKKWIHCFDSVTAVIFVAALSEYDQALFEETSVNRMIEALSLFQEVCNNRFFEDSSILLFLNKRDLYEQKVKRICIKDTPEFADFEGPPGDAESGIEYFVDRFLSMVEDPNREVRTAME
ncbi:unnamed protein product [Chrysoparadoxa australica]